MSFDGVRDSNDKRKIREKIRIVHKIFPELLLSSSEEEIFKIENAAKRYTIKDTIYRKQNLGIFCMISPTVAVKRQRSSRTNPAIIVMINFLFNGYG